MHTHITQPIITKTDEEDYKTVFSDSSMLKCFQEDVQEEVGRFCMSKCLYRPLEKTTIKELVNIALKHERKYYLNKITLIGGG